MTFTIRREADAAFTQTFKTGVPSHFPDCRARADAYFLLAARGASVSRPLPVLVRRRDVMTTLFWTSFTLGIAHAISPTSRLIRL